MKSKTFLVVAAAIIAASCSNLEVEKPVDENENRTTDVCFSIWDYATKASATLDEKKVKSLQMFVFGEDGTLEVKSAYLQNESSVNLQCTKGEKKVVAVVNAPNLPTVRAYTDFNSLYSNLSDNTRTSLVMVGDTTVTVSVVATEPIAIKVKRLGVRVAFKHIINNLANKSSLLLKKVYLINAAGDRTYLGGGGPTVWYNKSACLDEVPKMLTFDISSVTVENNYKREYLQHHAYCYPNPVETDTSEKGEWTERFTRLVVETEIEGNTYYYPISLPGLKANTAYDLSLIITRLGSDDPDVPVTTNEITYSLEMVDWADGGSFNETI
ncbi:MAG: fimbrial protein [Candidatus Cryptobacteroides sp.]